VVRITVKGLTYRYRGQKSDVLRGISSSFSEGKVTALLGPNGSGKTTIFRILFKVLDSYKGSVHVDGRDLRRMSLAELSELMSWVPQEEDSLFPYSVGEYLMLGRAPHLGFFSVPTREDEKVVVKTLAELGIPRLRHRDTMGLSGGEKRLVFIARALVQEPQVLILDEPTAHLDMGNKAKVLGAIREAADSGKTVIFSTHDTNEASLVADDVKILNGGEIVKEGDPRKVLTKEVLRSLYGVKLVVREVNKKPIVELSMDNFQKRAGVGR